MARGLRPVLMAAALGGASLEVFAGLAGTGALMGAIERRIPLISLADLLNEVDRWTGFLRHFTHLVSDQVPEGERRQMLIAAVMGLGMNHCLGRLARSTPFSYPTTRLGCGLAHP